MTSPGEFQGGDDISRRLRHIIGTIGGSLPGEELDMDRVMPDLGHTSLTDEELAEIRDTDHEGVPIPYTLQFVKAATEWSARLQEGGSSPELVAEINTGIGARETRYPDAPIWDRIRGSLAKKLQEANDPDAAIGLAQGIQSKHIMARTAIDLTESIGVDLGPTVLSTLMDRFRAEADTAGMVQFLQAIYDEYVRDDPNSIALDAIEALISLHNPNYDPLYSWAESMKEDMPDFSWDNVPAIIEQEDGLWPPDTPLRHRQFAMVSHFGMIDMLDSRLVDYEQSAEHILNDLAIIEAGTEPARIWDQFRYAYGLHFLRAGQPELSLEFGMQMNTPEGQRDFIMGAMLPHGAVGEAFRILDEMTNTRIMTETLLMDGWPNRMGLRRLGMLIDDDAYPLEKRIDCLVIICNHLQAAPPDVLASYEKRLFNLRQRRANGQ